MYQWISLAFLDIGTMSRKIRLGMTRSGGPRRLKKLRSFRSSSILLSLTNHFLLLQVAFFATNRFNDQSQPVVFVSCLLPFIFGRTVGRSTVSWPPFPVSVPFLLVIDPTIDRQPFFPVFSLFVWESSLPINHVSATLPAPFL